MRCRAELCENWSGDGDVCPCAVLDLTPTPSTCLWCQDGQHDCCDGGTCECSTAAHRDDETEEGTT
jgi:hypothetical protein